MVWWFQWYWGRTTGLHLQSSRRPMQLGSCFTNLNLYDVWRCYHASERDYTFYSHVRKSFSRIDMLLVDQQSLHLVDKCEIGSISHTPITLSIHLTKPHPAPFMWKNNPYLLANPENQKVIASKLSAFFSLNSLSTQSSFTFWNAHMACIRGILIQMSSRWKKDQNKTLDILFQSLKRLEDWMKQSP